MEIRKLLIADPSELFCRSLRDLLGGIYDTQICHDGLTAMELLDAFQPDVLVMDLYLSGLDGLSLLRELQNRPRRPAVLVATRLCSDYVDMAMETLGADYAVKKPCNMRALAERVRELSPEQWKPMPEPLSAERALENLLLELNISARGNGFRCLEAAIMLYEQDPGQSVTKELYPEVARQCGGTGASVERVIRTAVHGAWARRTESHWRQFFRADRHGNVPRPSNTHFIATMAEVLRYQRMCNTR